jgi:hypothetical protein
MNVIELVALDGSVTYQIDMTSITPTEVSALMAADDANTWIAANATVTSTVAVQNPPPDLNAPETTIT